VVHAGKLETLDDFSDHHAALNTRVVELRAIVDGRSSEPLVDTLEELREEIFLHFAREEEGLFPFAVDHVPELGPTIDAMSEAHDAICGVVARMYHFASSGDAVPMLAKWFARFEEAYAQHAAAEAQLLDTLRARLDADEVRALAELLRGI
jgi:hypothetical protein